MEGTEMNAVHIVGVDPGQVHTGVVRLVFNTINKVVLVDHHAVAGPNATMVDVWVKRSPLPPAHIFIEDFVPRSHFGNDARMIAIVSTMRQKTKGTLLKNTGVKKVVRRPLMELLGVWTFSTPTHHQDLRSAARILLLGMLKDEELNMLLTTIVIDAHQGLPWSVHH